MKGLYYARKRVAASKAVLLMRTHEVRFSAYLAIEIVIKTVQNTHSRTCRESVREIFISS